jgi:hypothetical protein
VLHDLRPSTPGRHSAIGAVWPLPRSGRGRNMQTLIVGDR